MSEQAGTAETMLVPVAIGFGASLFLAALSFVFAGGGHGTYVPMLLCFPYAMLLAVLHGSIEVPHIALGVIQFPVYGALYARSKARMGLFWAAIVIVHVASVAVATIIAARRGNFL